MSTATANCLLSDWKTNPFELPPFSEYKSGDFEPAFEVAMKEHLGDLNDIVSNPEQPTFENTIARFDRSGHLYRRTSELFENLCSSVGTPEMQAVQLKLAPVLASHDQSVYIYPGLFERIENIYKNMAENSTLTTEQCRLVERFHIDFVRSGARFDEAAKKRYAEITEKLAELCTKFTQNVVTDETDITVLLEEDEQSGLPADVIAAAKQAAADRNMPGKCAITLSRSLVVPFLTFSDHRALRQKAWSLWTRRGELDPSRDNLAIAQTILKLRREQGEMHGYRSYAEYATADTMAGNPAAVRNLLEKVWTPAKASISGERAEIETYLKEHGATGTDEAFQLEPWDWRYYAEKVRQTKYNLDDNEVKPYFPLDRMVEAVFDCAKQLFGLEFRHRPDIAAYHPDVKTYEVYDTCADGGEKLIAIFLHDNYARPHKLSGAWMSNFRGQYRNTGDENVKEVLPVVANNNNFNKGVDESSTLLSFDDAVTLFHEFGHGLHGMLSNCTYQRLSGTNVLRDFVELPSQLFEHWISEPTVLAKHARHYQTGEPIPEELLKRLMAARSFNQGFNTVEYTSSALVDTALHSIGDKESLESLDIASFEKAELARLGMPQGMVMRHRPAHFQHLFSGSSYAAAYYVYLWAEVLDADAFDAFLETGNCFDKATADRLRRNIYSTGNSVNPMEAYRAFRGRDPTIEAMLKKKGLVK